MVVHLSVNKVSTCDGLLKVCTCISAVGPRHDPLGSPAEKIKVCTAEQKTEVFEARVSGDAGIKFYARIIFVFSTPFGIII